MTDTPKDRDDEAVEVMARAIAPAAFAVKDGLNPHYRQGTSEQTCARAIGFAATALAALRSAGYIVARPVADEGLRHTILREVAAAQNGAFEPWEHATGATDAILKLIAAREAALRAKLEGCADRGAKITARCLAEEFYRMVENRVPFAASEIQDAIIKDRADAFARGKKTAEADLAAARAALAEAEKRCETMREALVPFARAGELFPPLGPEDWDAAVYTPAAGPEYQIVGNDLRRARAATGAER